MSKISIAPISYLLSITASSQDPEVILAIFNTAGRGHALGGTGGGSASKTLWCIPKGRKNKEEVITQLKEMPAIAGVGRNLKPTFGSNRTFKNPEIIL